MGRNSSPATEPVRTPSASSPSSRNGNSDSSACPSHTYGTAWAKLKSVASAGPDW